MEQQITQDLNRIYTISKQYGVGNSIVLQSKQLRSRVYLKRGLKQLGGRPRHLYRRPGRVLVEKLQVKPTQNRSGRDRLGHVRSGVRSTGLWTGRSGLWSGQPGCGPGCPVSGPVNRAVDRKTAKFPVF